MTEWREQQEKGRVAFQKVLDARTGLDYLIREYRGDHRDAATPYDRELTGWALAQLILAEEGLQQATRHLRLLT